LLIEVCATIFAILNLPTWATTLVTVLLLLGFPIALIFAWAYEMTPEGLKKEKNVDRSESITRITGRKLDFTIIGIMALAIAYLVVDNYVLEQEPSEHAGEIADKSIAVLPFVALSSGEDDDYFADGLTEEILNALAQLPELQITARTSSFFFKGQNIPVPEIAARLEVAHVVEGTVRRDGDELRITAQLIRGLDDFHMWSQTYDRMREDVFAVQEDIAENIAEVLGVVLDDDARRIMRNAGIGDVEAFIAHQKGLEAYAAAHEDAARTSELLAQANKYFDQALESSPDLTLARIVRADANAHLLVEITQGFRAEAYSGEADEVLLALREEYDAAWRLSQPGNQRDILNVEKTLFSGNWSRLPSLLEQATLPGDCPLMNWTSEFVAAYGWADKLVDKYQESLRCNPRDISASWHLPFMFITKGDPESALQAVVDAENNGITHPWLEDARFFALLAAGRVDDPMARGPRPRGSLLLYGRQILREALSGDPNRARQLASEHFSKPNVDDWSSLIVAAIVGDRQRANEIAARADATPGGIIMFSLTVLTCFCGAPFDIEVAPNYRARLEEAGFVWPPIKRIDYPTKDW
jgi:TolB-like protein